MALPFLFTSKYIEFSFDFLFCTNPILWGITKPELLLLWSFFSCLSFNPNHYSMMMKSWPQRAFRRAPELGHHLGCPTSPETQAGRAQQSLQQLSALNLQPNGHLSSCHVGQAGWAGQSPKKSHAGRTGGGKSWVRGSCPLLAQPLLSVSWRGLNGNHAWFSASDSPVVISELFSVASAANLVFISVLQHTQRETDLEAEPHFTGNAVRFFSLPHCSLHPNTS